MSDINLIDRTFRKFNHVTLWGFLGRGLNAAETADEEPSEVCLALQTRTAVGWNDNRQTPVGFHQPEGSVRVFDKYMESYRSLLDVERTAVNTL